MLLVPVEAVLVVERAREGASAPAWLPRRRLDAETVSAGVPLASARFAGPAALAWGPASSTSTPAARRIWLTSSALRVRATGSSRHRSRDSSKLVARFEFKDRTFELFLAHQVPLWISTVVEGVSSQGPAGLYSVEMSVCPHAGVQDLPSRSGRISARPGQTIPLGFFKQKTKL